VVGHQDGIMVRNEWIKRFGQPRRAGRSVLGQRDRSEFQSVAA
jgi:hypothetical protein